MKRLVAPPAPSVGPTAAGPGCGTFAATGRLLGARASAAAWAYAGVFACAVLAGPTAASAAPHRVEPDAQGRLFALWRRPIVRTGVDRKVIDTLATPALVDLAAARRTGTPPLVVIGTPEGEVLALHQNSGALVWRYRHGTAIDGPITLFSEAELGLGTQTGPSVAVAAGRDATLVALRLRDGHRLWQAQLDAASRAPAVVGGRHLFVTTEASQVVALHPGTGRVLWQQGRPPTAGLALLGHGRPAYAKGRVFAAFADGFAVALDAQDGRILWERPLSLQGGRFVDADACPQVAGERVLFASVTDGVYALDAGEGHTVWQRPVAEVIDQVLLSGERPLLVTGDVYGTVRALHVEDGGQVWQLDAGAGPITGLVALGDGVAFLAGHRGLVWADAATGRPRSVQALGGMPGGGLAVAGDQVAHATRGGALFLWHADGQSQGVAGTALGAATLVPRSTSAPTSAADRKATP